MWVSSCRIYVPTKAKARQCDVWRVATLCDIVMEKPSEVLTKGETDAAVLDLGLFGDLVLCNVNVVHSRSCETRLTFQYSCVRPCITTKLPLANLGWYQLEKMQSGALLLTPISCSAAPSD